MRHDSGTKMDGACLLAFPFESQPQIISCVGACMPRAGGVMVRTCALSLGGRWFELCPDHTKDLKMVCAASLLDAQHLKRIEHGEITIVWAFMN